MNLVEVGVSFNVELTFPFPILLYHFFCVDIRDDFSNVYYKNCHKQWYFTYLKHLSIWSFSYLFPSFSRDARGSYVQSRSGESAKVAAGWLFVAAAGGSPDATRGRGHEIAGEETTKQFSGTVTAQCQQYYVCQLQGNSFLVYITIYQC